MQHLEVSSVVEPTRNVTAHAQKPELVFLRNGRVHFNRRGSQFSQLLAAEECGVDARRLATHSIRVFPLHFPSRASPCAIRSRVSYTTYI